MQLPYPGGDVERDMGVAALVLLLEPAPEDDRRRTELGLRQRRASSPSISRMRT